MSHQATKDPTHCCTTDPAAVFEDMYKRQDDPWSFATDPTELARYERIVDALGERSYAHAFEPGCSVGVLTEKLAARCGALLALDIAPTAVAHARRRCASIPHVTVRCGSIPADLPPGPLDLIVFSEVGYYFTRSELVNVVDQLVDRLTAKGRLVACHWTGSSVDHAVDGRVVHDVLDAVPGLARLAAEEHATFLLATYELNRPA